MAAGGAPSPPRLPSLITFDSQKLGHSAYFQRCSLRLPTDSEKKNDPTFNTWKSAGKTKSSHGTSKIPKTQSRRKKLKFTP